MNDTRIEPALTAEEWSKQKIERSSLFITVDDDGSGRWLSAGGEYEPFGTKEPRMIAAMIAMANAALPDDDPRKITRETVKLIQQGAESVEDEGPLDEMYALMAALNHVANALESYLPPEK